MQKTILPITQAGKWAVVLTAAFVLINIIFFIFMWLGMVTFDDGDWWNITVAVSALLEISSFVLCIIVLRGKKERSLLLNISLIIGICLILFLFLHSLFIHD